jgi:hypothetical protein
MHFNLVLLMQFGLLLIQFGEQNHRDTPSGTSDNAQNFIHIYLLHYGGLFRDQETFFLCN